MCGIFGHIKPKNIEQSRTALHTLAHRGPDQWSDWQDADVYLGHQRLSIMDLSESGRQPMISQDGRVIVTVNGEIYNYKELKSKLKHKYVFKSQSDSEVLLYGYLEWGLDKLLSMIEGMYAFALYDTASRKVYLVRDRVGIKPLYYSVLGHDIAWASELKALEVFHKNRRLEIDRTGVYDYLTYLYIPAPKTFYKNVFKLEPAHYLELDLGSHTLASKRYWNLDLNEVDTPIEAAAQRVEELVNKAVEQQLMSDVPVGFFLSGGMDSSVVVAAASKYAKKLNTYSIGFDIAEHDETRFAELVAKKLKTSHIRKEISVADVKRSFSNMRRWYDEPFADTSAFPTFEVSKLAKDGSTVVLTGDGGDEVFGGYNWYVQFKDGVDGFIRQRHADLSIKKRVLGRLQRKPKQDIDLELEFYSSLMGGLSLSDKAKYKQELNIDKGYDDFWYFRKYYRPELPIFTRLQYLDFHTYLPDDILTKVDRASMAVSLECRVPLLNTELIEFMFSLPESIRYRRGELKGLMKHAFADELPDEIIERRKKGFSIPTGRWRSELMDQKMPMQEFILKELFKEIT